MIEWRVGKADRAGVQSPVAQAKGGAKKKGKDGRFPDDVLIRKKAGQTGKKSCVE